MDLHEARQAAISAYLGKDLPQQQLMTAGRFAAYAADRDIRLRTRDLEAWDRVGAIHPLLIVRMPYTCHRVLERLPDGQVRYDPSPLDSAVGDGEHVDRVYEELSISARLPRWLASRPEVVVCPSVANFQPWSEYQQGTVRVAQPLYHPFQIFRVREVWNAARCSVRVSDFAARGSIMEAAAQELPLRLQQISASEADYLKELRLLLLIEDAYLPHVRRQMTLSEFGADHGEWYRWRDAWRPETALAQAGMSIKDLETLRLRLARQGRHMDPNRNWYELVRHVRYACREELKDDALLALDHYDAAEILGLFLGDLTGQRQPNVDDLTSGIGGEWKRGQYGLDPELFDYDRGHALPAVLRRFGLDPRTRLLLAVEGQTEESFIDAWAELMGIDLRLLGVRIIGFRGTQGLKSDAFTKHVRSALADGACLVLTVDAENDAEQTVQTWLSEGLLERIMDAADVDDMTRQPVGALLWRPCFEDANFREQELLDALTVLWADEPGAPDAATIAERLKQALAWDPSQTVIKAMEKGVAGRRGCPPLRKPDLGRVLATKYAESDRPITTLLRRVVNLAGRLRTARYVAQTGGTPSTAGNRHADRA